MRKLVAALILLTMATAPSLAETYARLTWNPNPPADGVTGYKILRSPAACALNPVWSEIAVVGALAAPSFEDTTTPPGGTTRLCYAVAAFDGSGNVGQSSNMVEKAIAQVVAPQPITDLRVTGITANGAVISATIPPGVKWLVRVAKSAPNWGATPDQPCFTSPCVVVGLEPNTLYYAMAAMYTGTLGSATFAPISLPNAFSTLSGPIVPVDTDGDGVVDANDDCIHVKGPASNRGCPEVQPPGGQVFKNIRHGKWKDPRTKQEHDAIFFDHDKSACKSTPRYQEGKTTITDTIVCKK